MDDTAFTQLVDGIRAGDEAAVARLLHAYEPELRSMVRVRLPRTLRTQFDSMDFVQAVWQSVLASPDRAELDFANPRHFLGFLAGVAQNKVWQEYRRRTRSQKYDLGREEPLYVRRNGREHARDLAGSDPTPSQEAQAADCYDRLVAGLTPEERLAVHLRREGLTFEEVAARTGLHERTVRRLIAVLRAREEERP